MVKRNGQSNGYHGHQGQEWRFTFAGGTRVETSVSKPSQGTSLADAKMGDRVWITHIEQTADIGSMLSLGIDAGAELEVISCTAGGSVVVSCQGYCFGFGASTARQILVTSEPTIGKRHRARINRPTNLRELPVGARGCVVGYKRAFLGYKGKLLAMGLQPGTAFTVIRHLLWSNEVEIAVQGTSVSLRQQEADALCVETLEESRDR